MNGFVVGLALFSLALIALLMLARSLIGGTASKPNEPAPPRLSATEKTAAFHDRAAAFGQLYEGAAHPNELLEQEPFLEAVAFLCRPVWTERELLDYATGGNPVVSLPAIEALGRRAEAGSTRAALLDILNRNTPWERFFVLRAIDRIAPADAPVLGEVLVRLDPSWTEPYSSRFLREFLEARRAGGESPALGAVLETVDSERVDLVLAILGAMSGDLATALRRQILDWRGQRIDREYLGGVGTVWDGDPLEMSDGPVIEHDALTAHAGTVEAALLRAPRRSVVLVGEHGVGKTAVVRSVGRLLAERGWVVFEAGHAEVVAGMPYIGQVEERLRELVDRLRGRPVLWYVPAFHSLALAGRHRYGPLGALDFLMPYVERGEIVILGEALPGPYEHLAQTKPRVTTAFDIVRVEPLDDGATTALVERWAQTVGVGEDGVPTAVRREALELAQQFLGDRAAPGNALQLLQITRERLRAAAGDRCPPIGSDDLVATLSMLTGLPSTILDERKGLDLASLRELFEQRVLGQREVVDALVERVAMIKAGTTDPTRPLGVFLFAGPTGTGKTEIAKTLAEFLFGSPDRMIRLDMSEFQTPDMLAKIVGGGEEPGAGADRRGGALVDRIRKQPFAVVLLDEFEKAHPRVWDLFLQVFDDGRLGDHQGNAADFRNAIIILTSNLGAVIPSGTGVGFSEESGRFHATAVVREVERSFRKEFLNRLDRVVVFRPFSRETMREILSKELTEAFRRRGLRNRAWSVEWDQSAIEFLLERGFTADLGARPLKRAVERYVLSPLSTTIVEHRVPEGDQFLFLRAGGGGLVVDFIDPDAPTVGPSPVDEDDGAPAPVGSVRSLAAIGLSPKGRPDELEVLRAEHARLAERSREHDWRELKRVGIERMAAPEFWTADDRFAVLGRIEFLDRIEAGLQAAGSLIDRLRGDGWRERQRFPRELVGRTATRLWLIEEAVAGVLDDEPGEAFVDVEAWSESGAPSRAAIEFAREIATMYRDWGEARGMQVETLEESERGPRGYAGTLAVSGFAAWRVLRDESGLHVLELPEGDGHAFRKAAARVRVVPQPETPAGNGGDGAALAQARATLTNAGDDPLAIVRHYRRSPSPLVRDAVHGWRTGHLDRVLAGDFDLRSAEARGAG